MKYVRVDTFALGSSGGGSWEESRLYKGKTPEKAWAKALASVMVQGFASEVKLTFCAKDGENLQ